MPNKSPRKGRQKKIEDEDIEEETRVLVSLKKKKIDTKSAFSKAKSKLLDGISERQAKTQISALKEDYINAEEKYHESLSELIDYYSTTKSLEQANAGIDELEKLENDFDDVMEKTRRYVSNIRDEITSIQSTSETITAPTPVSPARSELSRNSEAREIGNDLWKQLQRVSIPTFNGEKRFYQSWKAAFMTCVDAAPATPEYKLLQLRNSLKGDAYKAIAGLGHSAVAYEAALEKLEQKFGGSRRQIAIFMEELEKSKPVREGVSNDMEKLSDILDTLVVNLKEANRLEELGDGSLYLKIQQKLSEIHITNFQRWLFENNKQQSVENIRIWIRREAEFSIIASEAIKGVSTGQRQYRNNNGQTMFTNNNGRGNNDRKEKQRSRSNCVFCDDSHQIWKCKGYKDLPINERWQFAKANNMCFRCLATGHRGTQCSRCGVCGINGCEETHNRLLHVDKKESQSDQQSDQQQDQQQRPGPSTEGDDATSRNLNYLHASIDSSVFVAVRTVPVVLRYNTKKLLVNALLDDGSTKTYMNQDVATELGLKGDVEEVSICTINGKINKFTSMPINCTIESVDGKLSNPISGYTTRNVTGQLQPTDWRIESSNWPHLKGIKFPKLANRKFIDILIGVDNAELHSSLKEIRGLSSGDPVARLTPLGWTCVGQVKDNDVSQRDATHLSYMFHTRQDSCYSDVILNENIRRFWEVETLTSCDENKKMSTAELEAWKKANESIKVVDERYEIGIPWKDNGNKLSNNYNEAMNRLESLERKLNKDDHLRQSYCDVIKGHLEKGYIKRVNVEDVKSSESWFLPHFAVRRDDKATTKTRVVFDAAAKAGGLSLNDLCHAGPKLQNNVVDVLLRFRKNPIAIVSDVKEMYLQIGLAEEDRKYHRFLWRNCDGDRPPDVYEFNRLVFGGNSSPFLAHFVTQYNAKENAEQLPLASEAVLKSTYMDDTLDSVRNNQTAIELYEQLVELWEKVKMHARKWMSNSSLVLEHIPEKDHAEGIKLDGSSLPHCKTLGVLWKAKYDCFGFDAVASFNQDKVTKRTVISKLATIFDPLGFLSPYIIRGKIIMQKLWLEGCDWDEKLDNTFERNIREYFNELNFVCGIEVPRPLTKIDEIEHLSIHVFCDASVDAYAAVAYTRTQYVNGEVCVSFIASKSKVASLKAMSIPRLELLGATLGVELSEVINRVFNLPTSNLYFWSDSMNVLWWIRRQSRILKTFVANRVSFIQDNTDNQNWQHVNTKENPADIATRGSSVADLKENELWWEGPTFLKSPQQDWPKLKELKVNHEAEREVNQRTKFKITHFTTDSTVQTEEWRLTPERFSSWRHLKRIYAYVKRFIKNCRVASANRQAGELSVDELNDAETSLLIDCQRNYFNNEYKSLSNGKFISKDSKLIGLNPFIDKDGIMRSNSRLALSENLSYDVKYPVIMPKSGWISKLLVRSYHEDYGHTRGVNHILSEISQRYWLICGREIIRSVESDCYYCKRKKVKNSHQIMAPLPTCRTEVSLKAFDKISIDYAGPFCTMQGRGKTRAKRYLCLFTCLGVRAIHLELSYDLDTDSFLNAFNRMTARRGLPSEVYSDNGTNFVGANNELKALVNALDIEEIQKTAADKGIKWHFNPPAAPHFGGVHESMVKSAKKAIYSILSNADIRDEELHTCFVAVESLLNSRPLTYQSASSMDDVPLTPNHFLHGSVGGTFAPQSVDDTAFNLKTRWRRVQEIIRHFWQRWLKEWLPSLGARAKWRTIRKDIEKDDIVIVVDPKTPRGSWPLGRVIEVYAGKDGHVTTAKVLVKGKEFTRPIVKLCPLDLMSK